MSKESSGKLTARQQAELKALAAMPDDRIDYTDAPPLRDFAGARRGVFYRPVRPYKEKVTIRLDVDVLAYYRAIAGHRGYQTRINAILRDYAAAHPELAQEPQS